MLTIQINPNLHRAIHICTSINERGCESLIISELSLSKEESSALTRIFSNPATNRTQDQSKSHRWG